MADDELAQMAERALADAEVAYRADPSEANQRRIQSAWSFVQRARQGTAGQQMTPDDKASKDAAEMTGPGAPQAVLALVDAVLVDLAVRRTMYVGRRGEDGNDATFVIQTGEEGRARLRLPELSSDDSIERMIVDVQTHLGDVFGAPVPLCVQDTLTRSLVGATTVRSRGVAQPANGNARWASTRSGPGLRRTSRAWPRSSRDAWHGAERSAPCGASASCRWAISSSLNSGSPATSTMTWATTVGYATTRESSIRGRARPAAIIAFYRRVLQNRWQLLQVYPGFQLNFKRGNAYLEVSTAPGHVELKIDYDCYKGSSSPECFGP